MPTLEFKGKQFIYSHHHSVPFRELLVDSEKSLPTNGKSASLDDNLIIHGDNLHALKALMPQYAGKIKCIYIDPPYNTGNEGWCYNDNVNSPLMKEWITKNANPVDKEDMQRHDKWLCMMYPRLKLLHELLADDGVIFVSINDIEVHSLKLIMDEVFGEENFVADLPTIMNLKGNHDAYGFSDTHEHTLAYTKISTGCNFGCFPIDDDALEEWLEDDFGLYKKADTLRRTGQDASRERRPKGWFPVFITPENTVYVTEDDNPKSKSDYILWPLNEAAEELSWSWGKKKITDEPYNLIVTKNKTGKNIYKKQRPQLGDLPTKKPKSIFYKADYSTSSATNFLKDIFGEKLFSYPKPVQLIKDLISIITNNNDIILDSFAGSGTTAHAVLALNKEDGGNRKFILVEMEGYADTITAERVRRVINGVPTAKDEDLKAGLGGSFTFCELGKEISIEKIITGESLPDYSALASYVFYTATGKSLEGEAQEKLDYFVGETDLYEVYLIYKPDIAFLRGNDSALNDQKLKAIAARNSKKEKLVFATAKYMGQKELSTQNITFCQLPYAIHRIAGV